MKFSSRSIFDASNPQTPSEDFALSESLERFYDCLHSWDEHEKKMLENEKLAEIKLKECTESWLNPSMLRWIDETLVNLAPNSTAQNENDTKITSAPTSEIKDRFHIDLLRECIRSIPFALPAEIIGNISDNSLFFGQMLLHSDEDVARETSLALQQLMIRHPKHRSRVIQGMVSLTMKYDDNESALLQTLLIHLTFLVDLWVYLINEERLSGTESQVGSTALVAPDFSTVREGEAMCLFNLCHSNPRIRSLTLQLIRSFQAISQQSSLGSIIATQGEAIMQKARHRYVLCLARGIQQDAEIVRISHTYISYLLILTLF